MFAEDTIAVTGMGAITALGPDVDTLWSGLCRGERGFAPIRRFDPQGCRVAIAAEAPDPSLPDRSRLARMGQAGRTAGLGAHAAALALAQSRLPSGYLGQTGLVLGTTAASDTALQIYLERERRQPGQRSAAFGITRYPKRSLVDTVAQLLDLGGPRSVVNTACSSGLVAIITAVDWLRSGLCEAMVAGGADALTLYTLSGFCALRVVDPEPCRPFDHRRRGMSLGEGAGAVVLEPLARARKRGAEVLGLVLGTGMAADAYHLTAPDPGGHGAARAMRAALAEARIEVGMIDLVNAHGTGTLHNDRAEVQSVVKVLGEHARGCPLSTVKGHIGHCLGAAGAIEAVVTLQSLRHGLVPPTAGLDHPEAEGQIDFVVGAPRRVAARYALCNSFGFGGNSASLVLGGPGVCG